MENIVRNWWSFVLRGVLGVILGLVAFAYPGATIGALVILYGAFAMADGLLALSSLLFGRTGEQPWWSLLLEGIVGVAAGIVAFSLPLATALVLVYVVAAWSIIKGIFMVASAIRLRREIDGEWALGLAGVLSVVFGVLVMLSPVAGATAIAWILGFYLVSFGILAIVTGYHLRKADKRVGEVVSGIPHAPKVAPRARVTRDDDTRPPL